jgi:hypothetical protein
MITGTDNILNIVNFLFLSLIFSLEGRNGVLLEQRPLLRLIVLLSLIHHRCLRYHHYYFQQTFFKELHF